MSLVGFRVPVPVALGTAYAVLMIKADIEPNWRIERTVLVQTKPSQIAVKTLTIRRRGRR